MTPEIWIELATIIGNHYDEFDGFVVLHGSDTMAYTASALSFLLENLGKPVVLTGSQLPIGLPRTDARENLITALEIAAMRAKDGRSLIPEVCIYFEDQLYRGNRTHKFNSENFDAFLSPNYPVLAESGVNIHVFEHRLLPHPDAPLKVHRTINRMIGHVRLFPGFDLDPYVNMFRQTGTELVVLETYGSGNGPSDKKFLQQLKAMINSGIIILNVTQCRQGHVEMGKYESSAELFAIGILNGDDMTLEAALTKSMHVLATTESVEERADMLQMPLSGEMGAFF